jgi:hypothetical protein
MHRWSLLAAVLVAAALPATASAALTKVADPINVAPDDKVALSQFYPDVAMAADGSFAVSYSEDASPFEQVWVQRFTAGLTKVGERIPVGPATQRNTQPAIAMAPDGRFAVAFQTYQPFPATPEHLIEVQRFAADGTAVGAPLVPDGANGDNDGHPPAIAMADDGRLAVSWIGHPANLRLLSYAANGAAQTGVQQLGGSTWPSSARPSIGMAGDGHFTATAGQNPAPALPSDVPGFRFHADGTPDGGQTPLYTGEINTPYSEPAIGMADDGRTFLAFNGRHSAGSFESDVWGRRFDAAGTALGDRFGVSDYTTSSQHSADVEVDHDGDTLVAYEGQNGTQQWGYLRRFFPDGTPDGTEEHVSTSASGGLQRVHVDSDGRGRSVVAYADSFSGAFNEVKVARYNYAAVIDPAPVDSTPGPGGGTATPAPAASTPTATTTAAPVVAPVVAASKAPKVADLVTFPSTKSCASRRSFAIRLRVPKGSNVTQATVKVNGRRVAVRRGGRLRSTVDLRKLPKGRFTVSIELRLADGKVVKGSRAYRTCVAKQKGGKPKV